jgi:polysaccharide pyruvyl transferase WcaK-like protein
VVPDMAFSLPTSELPPPAGIRAMAQGRPIVAISPIAYAKPGAWSYQNAELYSRYLQEMARVASQLLQRDYFLVFVYSSLGNDDRVISEILERLDEDSRRRAGRQMQIPAIRTWKDLVALLMDVDFVVASRLHSTILAFVARTPTVAISFDPKVDWVMEDLGQTDYLLHIEDFTASEAIQALDRLKLSAPAISEQLASYRQRALAASALQYEALAQVVAADCRYSD